MVIQREGSHMVILEPAKSRIAKGLCPACEKPKSEWTRRTDWTCCSKECTEKYIKDMVYLSWQDLRNQVLKRDGYRCVKCGTQPTTEVFHYCEPELLIEELPEQQGCKVFKAIDKGGFVADHIYPIALGGDEWDIDNIQTLCLVCNKEKTAQDAGDIAKERRIEKVLSKNNSLEKWSA